MAKMVNVNREVKDSFYRYKMPEIICKIEGRGNGIKTAIPNMVDIAKALERPPSYPTKYLGVELGAQTQMYPADERYIVNGAFEASRFQEVLDGFIKKFVLCASCQNPETVLRVTKKKEIESSCKACGHRCFLPQNHKLTTFIINNPPSGSAEGKKGRSKEERRRLKREGGAANANDTSTASTGADSPDAPASNEEILAPDVVGEEEDDDMDWSVDTSEEAARERAAALGTGVTGLTMTNDLEKSMPERLEIFETYVSAKMKLPKFPAKEVVAEAERLDCKDKGIMVLVGALFKEGDVLQLLAKHHGLFQRFTLDNSKAEKNCLAAFEKLIEMRPELLKSTARIFKDLYDKDIVDEERFIAWADKASKKNVSSKQLAADIQAKAKPFIDWLREAEEEESEEDPEAGVEFVTAQEQAAEAAAEKAEATATAPAEEEEEDEIDIDNI